MSDGGVFINYRAVDSGSYGALLHLGLTRHFGYEFVFLDSESLAAGCDFVEELLSRVRRATVVLAVIGSRWLTATDGAGGRCIDNPQDWIRRELAEAFAGGVTVVPVLADDAQLPPATELPDDIAELGRCQYRRLRHRDATADLARLAADIQTLHKASGCRRRWQTPVTAPQTGTRRREQPA